MLSSVSSSYGSLMLRAAFGVTGECDQNHRLLCGSLRIIEVDSFESERIVYHVAGSPGLEITSATMSFAAINSSRRIVIRGRKLVNQVEAIAGTPVGVDDVILCRGGL